MGKIRVTVFCAAVFFCSSSAFFSAAAEAAEKKTAGSSSTAVERRSSTAADYCGSSVVCFGGSEQPQRGIEWPQLSIERLQLGIERLREFQHLFTGKRVGLITNQTGITQDGTSSAHVLQQYTALTALFSPEHGLYGREREGAIIKNTGDSASGLPVYSLYGETKRPTPEMLRDIDILCFDIQDVGARFYTYISTMAYAMEACARDNKHFIVFDRPNPIGGSVEGSMLEMEYRSFTGYFPIVQRHGMTVGELAQLFNIEYGIGCKLTVIPMQHWQRDCYFDELPRIWVPPSPNIPSVQTAVVYAGVCLFEGTNVSVGRGTAMPFQYIGAPFIDSVLLAEKCNALKEAGVRFLPAYFTPSQSLYAGKSCGGVYIAVTDRGQFQPVRTAVRMFFLLKELYPAQFIVNNIGKKYCGLNLLTGCADLTNPSKKQEDYLNRIQQDSRTFAAIRRKYLLY
ncbi:MAG: exo-beta-N-acetylmuramidase NamZ family protein [Treponema sp.]